MESPKSEPNNQIIISGVSSHHDDEQGSSSTEQGESSNRAAPAPAAPTEEELLALPAPPGFENYQLAVIDDDREYGCRYCDKKFSNKQALGGHQNAHKVERTMEKNDEETAGIGFYAGGPNPNPNPYPYPARMNMPAPFIRPSDFLNRSVFNWNYSCPYHGGGRGGVITYNPRPGPEHYAPYPTGGWGGCHGHHYMMPRHNMNIRLPNFGPGSANAFQPVIHHEGPPGFGRYVIRTAGRNRQPAEPVNLRNVPGEDRDGSGLDLTLKLGRID